MWRCPDCDKVYYESRPCHECGGYLQWAGEVWKCSNCDYSEEVKNRKALHHWICSSGEEAFLDEKMLLF